MGEGFFVADDTRQQLKILVAELDARAFDATLVRDRSQSSDKRAFYAGAVSGYEDVRVKLMEILDLDASSPDNHCVQS